MAGATREKGAPSQGRTLASGRGIWPNPQTGVLPGGGGGGRWLLRPAAAAAAAPLRGRRSAAVLRRRAGRKASALILLFPALGHQLPRMGTHLGSKEALWPPSGARRYGGSPPAHLLLKRRPTSYYWGGNGRRAVSAFSEGRSHWRPLTCLGPLVQRAQKAV